MKIYVDMDGVLVDFNKQADSIGFPSHRLDTDSALRSRFWHNIGKMGRHGFDFWRIMDPMPDAHVLWNYIKNLDTEILSATGHVGNADAEKRDWVVAHLSPIPKVNLVRKSAEKAHFAAPDHVLIDDRDKSIGPWIAAGGIGILHVSAIDTIRRLKELGI